MKSKKETVDIVATLREKSRDAKTITQMKTLIKEAKRKEAAYFNKGLVKEACSFSFIKFFLLGRICQIQGYYSEE